MVITQKMSLHNNKTYKLVYLGIPMKILKEPRTASELELEVRFEFSKFFRDTMHYLQEEKNKSRQIKD